MVLGIGNRDCGDDAAGCVVAQLVREQNPGGVEIIEHNGEATSLLAQLEGRSVAFIIDACNTGAPAGTVYRFDVNEATLPRVSFGLSTHGIGLAEAIELACILKQLPPRCIVYAVEGARFDPGAGLSAPVLGALPGIAARIISELGEPRMV
jgi:hydrogenase maturation protease